MYASRKGTDLCHFLTHPGSLGTKADVRLHNLLSFLFFVHSSTVNPGPHTG